MSEPIYEATFTREEWTKHVAEIGGLVLRPDVEYRFEWFIEGGVPTRIRVYGAEGENDADVG